MLKTIIKRSYIKIYILLSLRTFTHFLSWITSLKSWILCHTHKHHWKWTIEIRLPQSPNWHVGSMERVRCKEQPG